MKWVMVNYNFDPSWILKYEDLHQGDYLIFDRSDSGDDWCKNLDSQKVIKTKNLGNVDYDKLTYLVDNYETLPQVFLWGKTNLFKYISKDEFNLVKNEQRMTPLLTQNHLVYSDQSGPVCFYLRGMYYERNNDWYTSSFDSRYFQTYREFAEAFALPSPQYLAFPPGGNYILSREAVHKYSPDYYENLASLLPYSRMPIEACFCERSYSTIWQ